MVNLPFLSRNIDRHGNERLYVRWGGQYIRIREQPGTPEFLKAYETAVLWVEAQKAEKLAREVQLREKRRGRYAQIGRNRQAKRDFVARIKLDRGCVDCGFNACSDALHFDHLRDKKEEIGVLVARNAPMSAIVAEIEKCVVRCANCHAAMTVKRRNGASEAERTMYEPVTPNHGC